MMNSIKFLKVKEKLYDLTVHFILNYNRVYESKIFTENEGNLIMNHFIFK